MRKIKIVYIALMVFAAFTAGFFVQAQNGDLIDDSKELFGQIQLFADSITLISTDYVEPVKAKDLVYGAIRGMMNTLDGYSQFMDQQSFKEITEETKGEFGGIGIEVGVRDGVLTVIAPIEDTPAFRAGIKTGDKIVKIQGEATSEMSVDDAVKLLRGTPGTEVEISIVREEDGDILDFKMKRAIVKIKSIKEAKVLEDGIGYVKIVEFQQRTASDLKESIKKLMKKGVKNLVLDLRNNPGGLLDAAVETSELFLDKGDLIVYTEGRDPSKKMEFFSQKKPFLDGMEIVVLTNKGSASAAEILAGALKDHNRAKVVGTETFGKGSVQTVIPLQDRSALRLTTASYHTPSGRTIMNKGIEPDIYVRAGEEEEPGVSGAQDRQLGIAVKVLKKEPIPEADIVVKGPEPVKS